MSWQKESISSNASLGLPVPLDHGVPEAPKVRRVKRDRLGRPDLRAKRALLDQRVKQGLRGQEGKKGQKGRRARKANKAPLVQRVSAGRQVRRAKLDLRDLKVQPGLQAQQLTLRVQRVRECQRIANSVCSAPAPGGAFIAGSGKAARV